MSAFSTLRIAGLLREFLEVCIYDGSNKVYVEAACKKWNEWRIFKYLFKKY